MDLPRPDIQFTTTEDGVAIAYWEIGSGPPLILAQPLIMSHAESEWTVRSFEAFYLELAKYFRLVRLDPRGAGMSDEHPTETRASTADLCHDIDAVVNAMDLDEFDLAGVVSMGPVVIQYAAEHPESVSRLVLFDTGPVFRDLPAATFVRATDAVIELDVLPSFSDVFPSVETDDMHTLERLMRASRYSRPSSRSGSSADFLGFDVDDLMGKVAAKTLVIRSRDSAFSNQEQSRRLVTGINNAQMRIVPGTLAPFIADLDSVVEALVSFLTSGKHVSSVQADDELRTVVFTDLVASTEVLSRLGDDEGRSVFRDIESVTSELCVMHHGRLVKNLGDGSLISFKSTQRALAFSMELQERMYSSPFGLRIGMAAGEPIQDDDDIHGAVVAQASRIADLGKAGEIIVSDAVRQLALGKGFSFETRGEVLLKGFDEHTTVWNVTQPARP